MLDLSMALQWVYDNIYAFNGNKDMITLYGPGKNRVRKISLGFSSYCVVRKKGAGAAAAGLLAVAPRTRHMVRQIFGQVKSTAQDERRLLFMFIVWQCRVDLH